MDLQCSKLDDELMQNAINVECKRKCDRKNTVVSAKTVKNEYALIAAALKTQGYTFMVRLPKVQRQLNSLPEPKVIIDAIKGTNIELPCLLAMWLSLRLSEVLGLTYNSIKGDTLYVNQVKVYVNAKPVVKKLAKTNSSVRAIKLPPYIKKLIDQSYTGIPDDFIVNMPQSTLRHTFYRIMQKNGIELSFHGLRHLYASVSLTRLGIDPKTVQVQGGWSSSAIMDNIYNQTFSKEMAEAFSVRNDYFSGMLSNQKTKMQNEYAK